jgi:hypothetical protein
MNREAAHRSPQPLPAHCRPRWCPARRRLLPRLARRWLLSRPARRWQLPRLTDRRLRQVRRLPPARSHRVAPRPACPLDPPRSGDPARPGRLARPAGPAHRVGLPRLAGPARGDDPAPLARREGLAPLARRVDPAPLPGWDRPAPLARRVGPLRSGDFARPMVLAGPPAPRRPRSSPGRAAAWARSRPARATRRRTAGHSAASGAVGWSAASRPRSLRLPTFAFDCCSIARASATRAVRCGGRGKSPQSGSRSVNGLAWTQAAVSAYFWVMYSSSLARSTRH